MALGDFLSGLAQASPYLLRGATQGLVAGEQARIRAAEAEAQRQLRRDALALQKLLAGNKAEEAKRQGDMKTATSLLVPLFKKRQDFDALSEAERARVLPGWESDFAQLQSVIRGDIPLSSLRLSTLPGYENITRPGENAFAPQDTLLPPGGPALSQGLPPPGLTPPGIDVPQVAAFRPPATLPIQEPILGRDLSSLGMIQSFPELETVDVVGRRTPTPAPVAPTLPPPAALPPPRFELSRKTASQIAASDAAAAASKQRVEESKILTPARLRQINASEGLTLSKKDTEDLMRDSRYGKLLTDIMLADAKYQTELGKPERDQAQIDYWREQVRLSGGRLSESIRHNKATEGIANRNTILRELAAPGQRQLTQAKIKRLGELSLNATGDMSEIDAAEYSKNFRLLTATKRTVSGAEVVAYPDAVRKRALKRLQELSGKYGGDVGAFGEGETPGAGTPPPPGAAPTIKELANPSRPENKGTTQKTGKRSVKLNSVDLRDAEALVRSGREREYLNRITDPDKRYRTQAAIAEYKRRVSKKR